MSHLPAVGPDPTPSGGLSPHGGQVTVSAQEILDAIAAVTDVGRAVVAILAELERTLEGVTTCARCGCLCLPYEPCPLCRPEAWTG